MKLMMLVFLVSSAFGATKLNCSKKIGHQVVEYSKWLSQPCRPCSGRPDSYQMVLTSYEVSDEGEELKVVPVKTLPWDFNHSLKITKVLKTIRNELRYLDIVEGGDLEVNNSYKYYKKTRNLKADLTLNGIVYKDLNCVEAVSSNHIEHLK